MGLLMLPEVILYFPSLFLYPDPLKNISYLSPFLKILVFSSQILTCGDDLTYKQNKDNQKDLP